VTTILPTKRDEITTSTLPTPRDDLAVESTTWLRRARGLR
jgi:hypothetical protein